MQYYEKNMEILKNRFKRVYDKIREAEENKLFTLKKVDKDDLIAEIVDQENDFTIYIEKARRGGYTMKIKKEEKEIYFHSKYAPEREAKKIVKDFGFSSKKQNFILGIGLGYYLKQFNNKNKYDKIIVIEPFLSIFYAALCYNDLSSFLSQNNIILVIKNIDDIFDIIRLYIKINLEKEIGFLEHNPSIRIFEKRYNNIYQKIKETIDYQKINIVTNINQAKYWRNNIIRNLGYIISNPKADSFFGKFKDIPAICVSAGPSLDKNILEIKKAKNKALIFSVGTALKALLKNNIIPDIVVSIDGTDKILNQFTNLNGAESEILSFFEMGNFHKVQKLIDENLVFFSMKRNFSGIIEKIMGNYETIQTGGTVAHSMVDLAYKMGANPIILVGQDLAYKPNQSHASGTHRDNSDFHLGELFDVPGINEEIIKTDKRFLTMISFFNNYFSKRDNREFIDSTEGGVRLKGTKIMDLNDSINMYCDNNLNLKNKIQNIYYKNKNQDKKINKAKELLKDILTELKEAIEISEEQIKVMLEVKERLYKSKKLSENQIFDLEKSFAKYDKKLNNTDHIAYFVDRILIPERMKLEYKKSKYYLNSRISLEERLEVYLNFRINFVKELKESMNIFKEQYFIKDEVELTKYL